VLPVVLRDASAWITPCRLASSPAPTCKGEKLDLGPLSSMAWSDLLGCMELFSALLLIVGAHGVSALVSALSGSQELGGLSKDLFDALAKSETNIDERLSQIGRRLDELLAKPYKDALARGMRRIEDLSEAKRGRAELMNEAWKAFDEASVAAEGSPFQQAIAERYVLLMLLAMDRKDLAKVSLTRMEKAATAAAFEAMALTEWSREYYKKLLDGVDVFSISDDPGSTRDAWEAALESIGMCGRLLGEAAALAPELGLPPRVAPPKQVSAAGRLERRPDPRPVRAATRLVSRFEKPRRGPVDYWPISDKKPFWTFDIRPGEVLRVGSLTIELLQGEAGTVNAMGASYIARLGLSKSLERPIVMHLVHAKYTDTGYLPDRLERHNQSLAKTSLMPIPRSPKFPPSLGWTVVPPPTGVEISAGMVKADVPLLPLARSALAEHVSSGRIDPSRCAVRLNPAYTYDHFIIVTTPALLEA
jgi:hypothetical protein